MGEPAELAVSYRPSAFGALRNHQFRLIWLGLASATLGSYVQQFGLGWLVVQLAVLEGVPELAPFYVGLVGLARGVPALAFSLLGGVLADRMDRRKLLIIARVSGAGVALALALLVMTDQVNLGWIMALTFLSAMADSID
jgi:MFS family permease